jgi:hypothetical protein
MAKADWQLVAYGRSRTARTKSKQLSATRRFNQSINPQWHNIEEGARQPTDADIKKAQFVTIRTTSGTQQGYWNIAVEGFETVDELNEYLDNVVAEEYA